MVVGQKMSAEIQTAVKVDSGLEKPIRKRPIYKRTLSMPYKKHKQEENSRHRCCRKKTQHSFSGGNTKLFPSHKKRNMVIPPTKFLLGGNINDPLNLNSLQDEEINRRMNAVTPQSSPMPTPQHHKGEVEVIIPPNINDPLNLAGAEDDNEAYAASLTTPVKKIKKKHKKKKHRSSTGSSKEEGVDIKSDESKTDETFDMDVTDSGGAPPAPVPVEVPPKKEKPESSETKSEVSKPTHLDLGPVVVPKEFKKPKPEKEAGSSGGGGGNNPPRAKKFDKDKIVSPVIPQPGAWTTQHRFRKPTASRPAQQTPKFKEQNKRFQYGNYNRYYGYRNPNHEADPRLKLLAARRELFEGKDVLDLGCNIGLITLSIARDLGARKVVGLDLDRGLIEMARANMRRFRANAEAKAFPISMPLTYGPLDVPGIQSSKGFPHNVSFVQGNYVLQSDVLVELEQPQFDVILCLSVTKWLHLNWGDAGLKRAFKRMFAQLRPGGTLILEPQSWPSYSRKKNLTETIWKNYQTIQLYPTMFTQFLLTEVGFSKCEVIGAPIHPSRGFQRAIKVFTKGETPCSPRTPADKREEEETRSGKQEIPETDKASPERDGTSKEKANPVETVRADTKVKSLSVLARDTAGSATASSDSVVKTAKECYVPHNGVKRKLGEAVSESESPPPKKLHKDTGLESQTDTELVEKNSNSCRESSDSSVDRDERRDISHRTEQTVEGTPSEKQIEHCSKR